MAGSRVSEQSPTSALNPLIVYCVRGFGDKAGNLYDHPKVKLVLSEGRNFIERSDERFDCIALGWVD